MPSSSLCISSSVIITIIQTGPWPAFLTLWSIEGLCDVPTFKICPIFSRRGFTSQALSCAHIIARFITHYHPVSHPCDIISYQQTSVSASADIVAMSDKRNLSSERNSMCDLWRHLSSCVLLCGAIDGVRGALMGPTSSIRGQLEQGA